jgi:hypothetical protein
MLTRIQYLLCTSVICIVGASAGMGQTSFAEFQKILHEKANFEQADLAALQFSQPIVRIAPVFDKREVAVSGVINISAGADEFLKSYRDSMRRKSNAAILEIGGFSKEPALADLQDLTIDPGDIEDLKACVVGDCQVKLSASMIERFRKEIDWESPDYQLKVTNLFKQILLDYVRDYVTRGEAALIEYNDKREEVSLANGQRALAAAPSYINYALAGQKSDLRLVEDAIVWSKIKFGLKPVLAINHITIYRRDRDVGPQVLIASRQIYANHYFNASRALTAFVSVPGAAAAAYLVYENRSLADGLEGPFSKIKREVVEKKAVEGLRKILQLSKSSLEGQPAATAEIASYRSPGWGQRLFGGIRPLLWLLVISALIALSVLGRRRTEPARKTLKPESAKS